MITRIDENKNKIEYNTLKDAAAAIDTKMEPWKVQMLIANAIETKKRAFKCSWYK